MGSRGYLESVEGQIHTLSTVLTYSSTLFAIAIEGRAGRGEQGLHYRETKSCSQGHWVCNLLQIDLENENYDCTQKDGIMGTCKVDTRSKINEFWNPRSQPSRIIILQPSAKMMHQSYCMIHSTTNITTGGSISRIS